MRWGLIAVVVAIGCRAASPKSVAIEPSPPPRLVEDKTGLMDAAVAVIGGNVGALVHSDRLGTEPATWNVARVGGYGKFLDDAGLDPFVDVERVFVTATGVVSCRPIIVVQHRLASTDAVFERLLERSKSPGKRVAGLGVYVRTRKAWQFVFAARPNALVMMPRDLAQFAEQFRDARPLPPPVGAELWVGWSNESGWPPFPGPLAGFSLTSGTMTTYATETKHIVKLRGHARSQTSARENRDILQRAADSILKMPVIGAMLFDPIEFRVEGDEVATEVMLNPPEHQWILAHMTDGCW
jgi:hypothetical protein